MLSHHCTLRSRIAWVLAVKGCTIPIGTTHPLGTLDSCAPRLTKLRTKTGLMDKIRLRSGSEKRRHPTRPV